VSVSKSSGFRLLSAEEFAKLGARERIEYLREAIAALEEFKAQLRAQIVTDTAETIRAASLRPARDV
jgi:hypothetical protein